MSDERDANRRGNIMARRIYTKEEIAACTDREMQHWMLARNDETRAMRRQYEREHAAEQSAKKVKADIAAGKTPRNAPERIAKAERIRQEREARLARILADEARKDAWRENGPPVSYPKGYDKEGSSDDQNETDDPQVISTGNGVVSSGLRHGLVYY